MRGLDEVLRKIKEKGDAVQGAVYAAVAAGALVIQTKAAQTTAWKNVSGDLRASIHTEIAEIPGTKTVNARIGTRVPYGKWLEYGTSRMKPHAWLRPAFDEKVAAARKEMARVFQIALFK